MGMKSNYKNSLYDMYLCEYQKNIKLQKEIRELELEIKNLIYEIDKLTNQVNKDSTNFGITTSNEIKKRKINLVQIHIIIVRRNQKKWWTVWT